MHDMDCAYCSWFGFQAFSHGVQEAVEVARPLCGGELSAHAVLSVIMDRILEREIGHNPAERYEGPPVLVSVNLVESGDSPVVTVREELGYPGGEVVVLFGLRIRREDLRNRVRKAGPVVRRMEEPAVLGYWDLERMQRVYSFRSSSRWPVVFADVFSQGRHGARNGQMVLNISDDIDLSHVQRVNAKFSRFTPISRIALGAYKSELVGQTSKFGVAPDPVWGLPVQEMMLSVERMIARVPVYAEEKWRKFDRALAGKGIRSLGDLLRAMTLSISRELGLRILQE